MVLLLVSFKAHDTFCRRLENFCKAFSKFWSGKNQDCKVDDGCWVSQKEPGCFEHSQVQRWLALSWIQIQLGFVADSNKNLLDDKDDEKDEEDDGD